MEALTNIKAKTNTKVKTVLIVDDEIDIQKSITNILNELNYQVINCLNPLEVENLLATSQIDIVLLDIWMAEKDGLQVLRDIKLKQSNLPIIIMSGHANINSMVQITKSGADAFLEKPFSREELLLKLSSFLFNEKKTQLSNQKALKSRWRFKASSIKQKTLQKNIVIKGKGLHSGANLGIILTPLKENSGIIFEDIASGITFSASHEYVGSYHYSTNLKYADFSIGCVEHLLSALHVYGITNVCIKANQEVPILDGSSIEWCNAIEEAGIVEQKQTAQLAVINKKYEYVDPEDSQRKLIIEPYEGLAIDYTLKITNRIC